MKLFCPIVVTLLALAALASPAQPAAPDMVIVGTRTNSGEYNVGDLYHFTNGVRATNQTFSVEAETAIANNLTGEIQAEGDVTILDRGLLWRGTNALYNFKTGVVRARAFKTAELPFNLSGDAVSGDINTQVFFTTNTTVTTDDYAKPIYRIRARTITIATGKYFEARNATLYLGSVPVFYWPYYHRALGKHPDNFEFVPGVRSLWGPFLLGAYNWYGNSNMDGTIHLDERTRRGLGVGPDLLFYLGDYGKAAFRYYYIHDHDTGADQIPVPHLNPSRQRMSGEYTSDAALTNFYAKAYLNYQSDPLVLRDFFQREYESDVEPASYLEADQFWPNFTLDVMAQPRLVNFFETVERLPDVKLTGLPQQVGVTPVFYQSESSVGYFRRDFSDTNNPVLTNYSATRADTVQQFTLPENFFGWLNVTPRVGGRFTYYSAVEGVTTPTNAQGRAVFNTGVDFSLKASKLYPNVESDFWQVDGFRHIIEPDLNYAYVPAPSRAASHLPQFDTELPSLRLLPIEYPDYNSIDSVGKQDVIRLTLRNILQTKRDKNVEEFINWAIYTDWNLTPGTNHTFTDAYSDLLFRPRQWLTLDSSARYDLPNHRWRDAINSLIITPNDIWSVALSYRYLMNNDPEFLTAPGQNLPGHNLIGVSVHYRLNENWGVHVAERYEAQSGSLQEQDYTLYHDLRSWTGALTFRVTQGTGQPTDFGAFITLSLKAFPRLPLGADSDRIKDAYQGTSVVDTF